MEKKNTKFFCSDLSPFLSLNDYDKIERNIEKYRELKSKRIA